MLAFGAAVGAAALYSIWGTDLFPNPPDPTGKPETWEVSELRRWLSNVCGSPYSWIKSNLTLIEKPPSQRGLYPGTTYRARQSEYEAHESCVTAEQRFDIAAMPVFDDRLANKLLLSYLVSSISDQAFTKRQSFSYITSWHESRPEIASMAFMTLALRSLWHSDPGCHCNRYKGCADIALIVRLSG